jgi:hypothetical protein
MKKNLFKRFSPLLLGNFLLISTFIGLSSSGCDSCPDLCSNTCFYANDNECDDDGTGSVTGLCDLGTDCEDCGRRTDNCD